MNSSENNFDSQQLVTEILQRIAELNRQLPPVANSEFLPNNPSGPPLHIPLPHQGEAGAALVTGSNARTTAAEISPSQTPLAPQILAGLESQIPALAARATQDGPHRIPQWLMRMGLLPVYADRLTGQLRADGGDSEASPEEDLLRLRAALRTWWRIPPALDAAAQSHVLVGPAGVGKTTVLTKWLAQAVLLGGRSAYVWRLDGRVANTAEALTIYAEVLGVPVARSWNTGVQPVDIQFFDLPGADWRDVG